MPKFHRSPKRKKKRVRFAKSVPNPPISDCPDSVFTLGARIITNSMRMRINRIRQIFKYRHKPKSQ